MANTSNTIDADPDLLELRVAFWTKRLDHTLSHTVNASRLIYIVDGAVLALLAALINSLGPGRQVVIIMSFPMLVLAILNLFHSEFVRLQHIWYRNIDSKLIEILGDTAIERPSKKRLSFSSSHGVYRALHLLMASALIVAALLMFLYGIGCFPDIQ